MFIFGWTSPPAVMPGGGNWVGPCSAGIPFGFGSGYSIFAYCDMHSSMLIVLSSGGTVLLGERLYHRRLPRIRRICSRSQDCHSIRPWRGDTAFHYGDVPQPRQWLGRVRMGFHLPRFGE